MFGPSRTSPPNKHPRPTTFRVLWNGTFTQSLHHNKTRPNMAGPRVSLHHHVHNIDGHDDDNSNANNTNNPSNTSNMQDDDPEDTVDESMDPLEESGRTMDSSDEDVDEAVAEDMARFEETFVGINKRFRLINRIGEGMSGTIGVLACSTHAFAQAPSRLCTRQRTWNTTSSTMRGTSTPAKTARGQRRDGPPDGRIM